MALLKPFGHRFLKLPGEFDQLLNIIVGGDADHVVLGGVSLVPALVEVRCIVLPCIAEDDGKRLDRALMSLRGDRSVC